MKKHLMTIAALILCCIMAVPEADAQGRRGAGERRHSQTSGSVRNNSGNRQHGHSNGSSNIRPGNNGSRPSTKPGQGFKPGNSNNHTRPGISGSRPGNNNFSRPGNGNVRPGNNNHTRPGNDFNHGVKPDKPGKPDKPVRPGNGNVGGNHKPKPKPEHGFRPQPGGNHGQTPGHRPGNMRPPRPSGPSHRPGYGYRPGPHRPVIMRPPARPGRPHIRPWSRPLPPPHWRPSYSGYLFGNILGLSFGVAMNSALDNLYYSGYAIDGYMNNEVFLTGVNQFNYYWPDATLFFSNGGLVRSQFFNPTVGYDVTRFYDLYANLCSTYGNPASQSLAGTSLSATWFGGAGDYITLQYSPMVSGNYSYFTILTVGR